MCWPEKQQMRQFKGVLAVFSASQSLQPRRGRCSARAGEMRSCPSHQQLTLRGLDPTAMAREKTWLLGLRCSSLKCVYFYVLSNSSQDVIMFTKCFPIFWTRCFLLLLFFLFCLLMETGKISKKNHPESPRNKLQGGVQKNCQTVWDLL